jgi:hypothetical protein
MKLATPILMVLENFSPEFIEVRINQSWKTRITKISKGEFAKSNAELSKLLDIDLKSYGYDS